MSDILHEIHIDAPASKVYSALATVPGLAGWWTTTTGGESSVGKTVEFRFNKHVVPMRVDEMSTDKRVAWQCQEIDTDWAGTKVTFDLTEDNGRTRLLFGHREWKKANDFYAHCTMKWATFLLSLREYVERGAGRPFPHDTRI
jgi:uncharacterized protein YndB with AHSA1/START domain